jgi:hypothetical protein
MQSCSAQAVPPSSVLTGYVSPWQLGISRLHGLKGRSFEGLGREIRV